jgi:long-subunit acyl-CoA synthetase (AMP-forming)
MTQTVIEVLESTASRFGARPALREKRDGAWQVTTWEEHRRQVRLAARGLIALGVGPGRGVAILGANRPEWFVADLAAIAAGGVPTGIYATSTPEQCRYIAEHCDAAVVVVEDERYLPLFDRAALPRVAACVLMRGEGDGAGVLSWRELLSRGESVAEGALAERIAAQRPDDLCTLIYTSGTTGPPKGVMLSHRNVVWTTRQLVDAVGIDETWSVVSYLPLSHIAEQVVSLHGPLAAGACTWFAESLEQLGENLREARPHIFFAVPRVWEKIQARIEAAGAAAPAAKRWFAAWARRQGLAGGYADQAGTPRPKLYGLAERLVFSKVRERLGLDRARFCAVSAAPIGRDTLELFLSLGIPIYEIYGMTECTGPGTLSLPGRYRTGWAGFAFPGGEVDVAGDGEVRMRGPHVFLGYFKDPEATAETLDAEGWLHSGDIGELDGDGFLRITDRKKELLITSGGKNVAPQPLETRLRAIPAVAHAVALGDRRNYVAALLTLDPERLPAELAAAGSPARDAAAAAVCPVFRTHLERQVEAVNGGLARYESIRRFAVLPGQLTIEGGELTPTMKLKRRVIAEKYAREIEDLYSSPAP